MEGSLTFAALMSVQQLKQRVEVLFDVRTDRRSFRTSIRPVLFDLKDLIRKL
jgi:hypothetical protein